MNAATNRGTVPGRARPHRAVLAAAALAVIVTVALFASLGVGAAPGSWSSTGSMATPRTVHTATRLADGRVLAAGGLTIASRATATVELYDPGDGTWHPAGSMNVARSRHVAVLLADGTVLVAGGRQANGVSTSSAELYDPATDTWTPAASMSVARDNFTATLLRDGRVLVTGGVGGDGSGVVIEKSAETYDPLSGQWTSAGKLANRRFNHAAVRLDDGRVLVAGGAGPAGDCIYGATTEIFTPETGDWKTADPMASPRGLPALMLLPDGRALAAGGLTLPANCAPPSFPATATAELYDAGANRWSPTGGMATSRRAFGDARLPNGRALLAGGRNAAGSLLASAELYDPDSGAWASAGSLATARVGLSLTTLADGRVLASGGGGPTPLSSAELYTPSQ